MPSVRTLLFRIFYSTSFTFVFLLLITFICISPADALYQSYRRRRLLDIFLISGVYVVTALIAALIYASRLYSTRSVLRDIPKTYVPIDKGDLPGKKVWRLISSTVRRSAVVALLARPRAWRVEMQEGAPERVRGLLRPEVRRNGEDFGGGGLLVGGSAGDGDDDEDTSYWGVIKHRGWASPADEEMPGLEYQRVVAELVDLVEARAVSLAPLDPLATPGEDGTVTPGASVIEALVRPDGMGLRRYVARLVQMEVLDAGEVTTAFLTLYERARFAVEPLSEVEFKNLMRLFADLLRGMRQVNVDLIDLDASDEGAEGEYDEADRKSSDAKSISSSHSRFSTASSISGSVRRHAATTPRRASDGSVVVTTTKGDG